ncbi:unnamed protein product [Amoebophrya sp. A25]|nr:unnamed protein product [Amoebophrya sp. A25]|eukprot:GSA25T00011099001.1
MIFVGFCSCFRCLVSYVHGGHRDTIHRIAAFIAMNISTRTFDCCHHSATTVCMNNKKSWMYFAVTWPMLGRN